MAGPQPRKRGRWQRPRCVIDSWKTRDGKRRRIRLFEAWCNLNGRVRGTKGQRKKRHLWVGKEIGFIDWLHFRTWALENGYRKGVELDRIDDTKGYTPDNCQWLTKAEHTRKSSSKHKVATCACNACCGLRKPKPVYTEAPF